MKRCTDCGIEKELTCFSPQKKGRFGVTSICKPCTSERGKAWHAANRDYSIAQKAAYNHANKDRVSAYAKEWRTKNAERSKAIAAIWTINNRDKKRAATAGRRAAKMRAMPPWANMADIQKFYACALRVTQQTGIKANVDHIVPLQSDLVCGLHCAANLTIVTEALNKRKGNLWWPDMADGPASVSVWSTALMSKKRGSSLIEYTAAFMAANEVKAAA